MKMILITLTLLISSTYAEETVSFSDFADESFWILDIYDQDGRKAYATNPLSRLVNVPGYDHLSQPTTKIAANRLCNKVKEGARVVDTADAISISFNIQHLEHDTEFFYIGESGEYIVNQSKAGDNVVVINQVKCI